MVQMMKVVWVGAIVAMAGMGRVQAQTPLGTAFTYHGRLTYAAAPASGLHDLRFRLYDADVDGAQVGDTLCADNVSVADGLFTELLDFGAQFAGQQRFLEIEVRTDTGLACDDATGFTILTPRQALTAVPNALFALNADQLDGLDSTEFLQSIPVPLTLSGTSDTHIIRGENSHANGKAIAGHSTATGFGFPQPIGVYGESTADNGRGVVGSAPGGSGFGVIGTGGQAGVLGSGATGVWGSSTLGGGRGVFGENTGLGQTYGGYFEATHPFGLNGTNGTGVYGRGGTGVFGESSLTDGRGVSGLTTATGGTTTYGVYGESRSTNGSGVYGWSPSTSGSTAGGIFKSASTNGAGVFGHATAASGAADGGRFVSDSVSGFGVLGWASSSAAGGTKGGDFRSDSSNGIGVSGYAVNGNGQTYGVYGQSNSTSGRGVMGWGAASSGVNYGVYGQCQSPSGRAVYGFSATGGSGDAVFGQCSGTSGRGTVGYATAATGVAYGMWGQADSQNGRGVFGYAPAGTGLTYGVLGQAGLNGWAVYALGDMAASGLKPFRIDHPSDPENKYLLHYATESPYPQNFYSGNAVTDAKGYAWIELPEYFAEVNKNFKYQLTVVDDADADGYVQAKVSKKIQGNRFQLRTSAPGVEVSWRVEADRSDLYARFKNPKDVVEKQGLERGTYQHPDLYGQPPEKGMNYRLERETPPGLPPVDSRAEGRVEGQ